ncbi:MAG: response regulator [Planctomycetes bacterium]|nr:response regulator [Planctomycetota bacterium]
MERQVRPEAETSAYCLLPSAFCLLHFEVRDTGIGIPRDKQAHIFGAFAQADSSITRRYGGTGLGLAISSRLVGLMGGRIGVHSEVGQGSTFSFTAQFELSGEELPLPRPELQGYPVLVVDDNVGSRTILEEVLGSWQMQPTTADSAAAALAVLEKAREAGTSFPLVLIDAHMPEKDGFTLAEHLRQNPCLAGAMVMMLTPRGLAGEATRCRELGVDAFLIKPLKQSELRDAILTALRISLHDAHQPGMASAPAVSSPRRCLTILVAEDNAVNQKVAAGLLGKQGHQVILASNGREALTAFDRQPVDLVLMDLQMPDLSGFETTAAIRAREQVQGGRVPILAMTAHAVSGVAERCREAGMDGYLSKPVDPQHLFHTLDQFFPPGTAGEVALPLPVPQAPLDQAAILARVGGDLAILQEIIQLFAEDQPRLLAEIRAALAEQNAPRLERAAHKLKGSVSNFAAGPTMAAALRLERLAGTGSLAGADEALEELEAELQHLLKALDQLAEEHRR